MGMEFSREGDSSVVRLEGCVDLSSAAELKAVLLEIFEAAPAMLTVDLASARELHIAILQLVWAASREAHARHIGFRLQRPQDGEMLNYLIDIGASLPSNGMPESVRGAA